MSAYTDWLADKDARRLVLVELVSPSEGTRYVGSQTYVTGPADTPANTVYDGVLIGEITIEHRVSGPMEIRGGADNVSDLVIANHDGRFDDWPTYPWDTVTIFYGDPSWSVGEIRSLGRRGVWKVAGVEANDQEVRFELVDRYEDLRTPIQQVIELEGGGFGERRPICYGYPKNVTPQLYRTDAHHFNVHDDGDCEDQAVARYINQVANTTIVIGKERHIFTLAADPEGRVTADVKGAKDSGGTWLTTPGECLLHALTREGVNLYGFARGGSSTTVALAAEDDVSTVDDAYNGVEIRRGKPNDPNHDKVEAELISDYDGATRTATLQAAFTYPTEEGDGYRIFGIPSHFAPLTAADCDSAAFDQLDVDLPYEIGLWIDDGRSAVDLLDNVLAPGAWHCWTAAGQLTVGILKDPSSETADLALTDRDLQDGLDAIELVDVQPPVWSMRLGYDRNHTVESATAVLDGIDATRMAFITREYRWLHKEDPTILAADPAAREVEIPTVFTTGAEAQDELERLWALFSAQRSVYTVRAFTEPVGVDPGSVIEVTDARHGLAAGRKFILLGIVEDLTNQTTELELWG